MPAKQLSPRSEDGLAMITDQVEQHASYTSVDPAYIERLQDDIKISCERLEEHCYESFLVTVSSAGHLVMGSAKGRQFLEERMGLIEDFINFCMGAMPVKVENVDAEMDSGASDQAVLGTEGQIDSQTSSDYLSAYDDDTDDNDDSQNDIGITPDVVDSQTHDNDIKTKKNDEKLKTSVRYKTRKRSKDIMLAENMIESDDVMTKIKAKKTISAKGRSKSKKDKQKEFPCERCGYVFLVETHLQEHNLRNSGCKDKPKLTEDEKHEIILESTVSVTDKNTGEPKRKTIRELVDNSEAPFDCEVCFKSFDRIRNFKRHIISHAETKPFECIICCQTYSSGELLRYHMPMHNLRPFNCTICHKRYKTAIEVEKHTLGTHEKKGHEKKGHQCRMCDYVCESQAKMKSHFSSHLGGKPDTWICEFCGNKYSCKHNMETHRCRVAEGKPYVCDLEGCVEAFRTQYALNEHKCLHDMACAFICDICGKSYKVHRDLQRHRNNHVMDPEWSCQYCEDKFKSANRLKTHIANFHPDKIKEVEACSKFKFYPCTQCDRVLINKKNIDDHMNIHTGNTPHKCRHCNKGFSCRKNMHAHEKTHTGVKKLRCHLCKKKYGSTVALQAHMKRLHDYEIDNDDVANMEKKMYGNPDPNKKKKGCATDGAAEKTGRAQKEAELLEVSNEISFLPIHEEP